MPTILLLILQVKLSFASVCLHDLTQFGPIYSQGISYTRERTKRQSSDLPKIERVFRPIRIKEFFLDVDEKIKEDILDNMKLVLKNALNYFKNIISVMPVKDPIRLKRKSCLFRWQQGNNIGKCSFVKQKYQSEYCSDAVKIPSAHLDGLYTWNNFSEVPAVVYHKPGTGVVDADLVLYVTILSTDFCKEHFPLAYAGYCRVDQFNRPIAGYVNFCRNSAIKLANSSKVIFKSIIHELFHVLGFSKNLFKFYKGGLSSPVQYVKRAYRLITPNVVHYVQMHFNCTRDSKFGAPLHYVNGEMTSHWHPVMMFSSIMTPNIYDDSIVAVDPITLAALEDTGWYKVNYSLADKFLWGKDAGCLFGNPDTCVEDSVHFCQNESSIGCDYLHISKGHCQAVQESSCGIFMPESQNMCSVAGDPQDRQGNISLCLPTLFEDALSYVGECYTYRCGTSAVEVSSFDFDWIPCPMGAHIHVHVENKSRDINCPSSLETICPYMWKSNVDVFFPKKFSNSSQDNSVISVYQTVQPVSQHQTTQVTLFIAKNEAYGYLRLMKILGIFCILSVLILN